MKNTELMYLAVAYSMGIVLYLLHRGKNRLTVSETAAASPLGRQVFFWGLLILSVLFMKVIVVEGQKIFNFSPVILLQARLLAIFQILTGAIPARGKWPNRIHLFVAFSMATQMVTLLFSFLLTSGIDVKARIIIFVLALSMLMLLLSTPKIRQKDYFKFQNYFFGCWHIALLALVFLG